jgi:hypothetical protein
LKLGRVDVERMLRSMSATQFRAWVSYAELEPFDETRADRRAALIAWMLAEINRDRKKRPSAWKIEDFLLKYGDDITRRRQTWQEQQANLLAALGVHIDLTKKGN